MILEARIKLLTDGETLRGAGVDKRNEQTRGTGNISEHIHAEMMDFWRIQIGIHSWYIDSRSTAQSPCEKVNVVGI